MAKISFYSVFTVFTKKRSLANPSVQRTVRLRSKAQLNCVVELVVDAIGDQQLTAAGQVFTS